MKTFVCGVLILQLEITRSLFIDLVYWFEMPITVHSIHSSMNPKIIMPFSAMAIAAVALLFTSGPIISSQQALAFVYVHGHHGYYGHFYRHGYYGHFYRHGYYGHFYRHGYYYGHPYHRFYRGHFYYHRFY
jgi:hypothetical protein